VRLPPAQLASQEVGEEAVIAIPLAALVERDQEQAVALQRFQHRLTVPGAGDGITQRPAQAVEHAGLEQKLPDILRTTGQHIRREVIRDVSMATAEIDFGGRIHALQARRRELQRRRPAFELLVERGDGASIELVAPALPQELPRLVELE